MIALPPPRALLLLLALTALSACGNKGDLFRADPAGDAADGQTSAVFDTSGARPAHQAP